LMTNHYHMLVETPEANLSRAIQWVNVSYARYFNGNGADTCFKDAIKPSWWMPMNISNSYRAIFT
jgi:REP element-mobilizing transposase RayT